MGWLQLLQNLHCCHRTTNRFSGGAGYSLAFGVAVIVLMIRRIVVNSEILPGGDLQSEALLR